MPWVPKKARSAVFQVCASLILRPDPSDEDVVVHLAGAVLYNKEAFETEAKFRELIQSLLQWPDENIDQLIASTQVDPDGEESCNRN